LLVLILTVLEQFHCKARDKFKELNVHQLFVLQVRVFVLFVEYCHLAFAEDRS
jgi:hypothetical protein